MNEPNHLENRLHSWTPRRPAAGLRDKIFSNHIPAEKLPHANRPWHWLAPVTLCAITMLMILGNKSPSSHSSRGADTNLFFASITMNSMTSLVSETSELSAYALSKVDLNLEQNVWREATFESTNHAQTPSSKRSLPVGKTNSLTL